jgi:hypothetical protein
MATEHLALAVCALIFLAALVYAARARKSTPAATLQSLASTFLPVARSAEANAADLLVQLIKRIQDDGLNVAAKRQVDAMASAAADEHAAKMAAAVAPNPKAPA